MNDDSSRVLATTKLAVLPRRRQLSARAVRARALKNCLAIVDAVNVLVASELGETSQLRLLRSRNAVLRMAALIDEELQPDDRSFRGTDSAFVSAAQVLNAVRVRVEDFAAAKRIRLDFQVGAGGVRGDLCDLVEAMSNLVKNSIEWSSVGSTVLVTSSESEDGGQFWTVRDTGCGIPRTSLPHLGVPFYSRRAGGSGLGIAVACDIFQNHGGQVHVESARDWGTLVFVVLPPRAAP